MSYVKYWPTLPLDRQREIEQMNRSESPLNEIIYDRVMSFSERLDKAYEIT